MTIKKVTGFHLSRKKFNKKLRIYSLKNFEIIHDRSWERWYGICGLSAPALLTSESAKNCISRVAHCAPPQSTPCETEPDVTRGLLPESRVNRGVAEQIRPTCLHRVIILYTRLSSAMLHALSQFRARRSAGNYRTHPQIHIHYIHIYIKYI